MMVDFKRLLVIVFIYASSAKAQGLRLTELELLYGNNYTTFLFWDSKDNYDQSYDYLTTNVFNANLNFKTGRSVVRPSFGLRNSGAKVQINNVPIEWNLNYADLSFGYLHEVFKSNRLVISPGFALYGSYLIKGDQRIGTQQFAVKDDKTFKPFDFGCHALGNLKLKVTQQIALAFEYRLNVGIQQIENNSNQTTRNLSHSFQLGLTTSIH